MFFLKKENTYSLSSALSLPLFLLPSLSPSVRSILLINVLEDGGEKTGWRGGSGATSIFRDYIVIRLCICFLVVPSVLDRIFLIVRQMVTDIPDFPSPDLFTHKEKLPLFYYFQQNPRGVTLWLIGPAWVTCPFPQLVWPEQWHLAWSDPSHWSTWVEGRGAVGVRSTPFEQHEEVIGIYIKVD